jgi:hypothetical protein
MKCPHCLTKINAKLEEKSFGTDIDGQWKSAKWKCPECERLILSLRHYPEMPFPKNTIGPYKNYVWDKAERFIRPRVTSRKPVPLEVPDEYFLDYYEACLVLPDSPKASAALSRRCLQHLLQTVGGAKKGNLAKQIQQVITKSDLPSKLANELDIVRTIGNFATHTSKSKVTGEIVDVEPGEAEWNLEILEALFDYYFVEVEKSRQRKAAINLKLVEAGKKPLV